MNAALFTAKTGLEAQNARLQSISNNIANAETDGFKASRPEFAALMSINVQAASSAEGAATGGLQVGTGVGIVGSITDFSQGHAKQTDRTLDVMIEGDGFLAVNKEDGTRLFTRGRTLVVDQEGRLSTSDNYKLSPEISIPDNATKIQFNPNGQVMVKTADSDELTEVGQLEIVKFANVNGLTHVSGGYYQKNIDTSGDELIGIASEDGFGSIRQGFLETSNVNTVNELVDMINAQRGYEMASKAVKASSETMKTLNNSI
ncbi:TPA: flagellar basal-body rod protein FlgG [Vibrio vulnificus]|uniref:Flagellar basal-body rod protein FlgG n=1 Tax=Vibrio vulnificus TaxID=672 RepID=A0A8H9TG75_VIBVL|nr:flagellar basal-body rod protein FlgG [Vibrio vulnificus]HAS8540940.1 flagellar basal-body rod protein FlgG [Vibrio vulnificus]